MISTEDQAARGRRHAASACRLGGVWLVLCWVGWAGAQIVRAEDPSGPPWLLNPAGQGPLVIATPQAPSANTRVVSHESTDLTAATTTQEEINPSNTEQAGPRRGLPVDVRLVPASAARATAAPPAPRPLPPRRSPADSGRGAVAAVSAARPTSLVIGSLGVVLGLLAVIVWCTRRFAPPGMALLPKEVFEPLGRAILPGQQPVQLVRLGPKLLLVAQHGGSLTTLAEVTDPIEVEHLLGLCRRQRPDSASAAFREVLSHLAQGEGAARPGGSRQAAGGRP